MRLDTAGVHLLLLMECESSVRSADVPSPCFPRPLEDLPTLRWALVDISPFTATFCRRVDHDSYPVWMAGSEGGPRRLSRCLTNVCLVECQVWKQRAGQDDFIRGGWDLRGGKRRPAPRGQRSIWGQLVGPRLRGRCCGVWGVPNPMIWAGCS